METQLKIGDIVHLKQDNVENQYYHNLELSGPLMTIIGSIGDHVTYPIIKYRLESKINYNLNEFVLCKWWDHNTKEFKEEIFNLKNLCFYKE